MILSTVAAALREAGRPRRPTASSPAAPRSSARAFQELSELQRGLERATLETEAARGQTDALAAKNRELEGVVRELTRREARSRRRQLEYRDQADRDSLTGLHNRRYLAREVDRHAAAPGRRPVQPRGARP